MVKILMMSRKMITQGLLKLKISWKKSNDVISSAHDVINTISSIDSNYNVNVASLVTLAFLWGKLPQPQFYKDLTRKAAFFERWSWFKLNN